MKSWYVIYTHAKSEMKAANHLMRQGFDAYLPIYRKQRRHARRVEQVLAPLFPRYIFVNLDISRVPWRAINSTVGVINIVSRAGRPAPMIDGIIEDIRAREYEDGLIHLNTFQKFKKGDPIQISAGAMYDKIGIFDCADDSERVVVLLNLLGREVKVRLPAEAITAVA
jgi:transcriptional antiterminator RfaH